MERFFYDKPEMSYHEGRVRQKDLEEKNPIIYLNDQKAMTQDSKGSTLNAQQQFLKLLSLFTTDPLPVLWLEALHLYHSCGGASRRFRPLDVPSAAHSWSCHPTCSQTPSYTTRPPSRCQSANQRSHHTRDDDGRVPRWKLDTWQARREQPRPASSNNVVVLSCVLQRKRKREGVR